MANHSRRWEAEARIGSASAAIAIRNAITDFNARIGNGCKLLTRQGDRRRAKLVDPAAAHHRVPERDGGPRGHRDLKAGG
jgi:hypothetical protein